MCLEFRRTLCYTYFKHMKQNPRVVIERDNTLEPCKKQQLTCNHIDTTVLYCRSSAKNPSFFRTGKMVTESHEKLTNFHIFKNIHYQKIFATVFNEAYILAASWSACEQAHLRKLSGK